MATKSSKSDKKIIERAKKQFDSIVDYEGKNRVRMRDDKSFWLGNQWEKGARKSREVEGFERPCLTIPRINQFIDYVSNQQRQNKPRIKIKPKDAGAQEKYAENREGIAKHIQNDSKADLAHQKMFHDTLVMGRGHCIVNTEWVSDYSTDQKIVVDFVKDPLDVYMDIQRMNPDYSDCKHGFYIERMLREDYEAEHPKYQVTNWDAADQNDSWVKEKYVILAQYWLQEETDDELLVLELKVDGKLVTVNKHRSELDTEPKDSEIKRSRKVKRKVWKWYLMNNDHILKRETLVCKEIPIVTCIGVEDRDESDWVCKGMVRELKDSARMYNFYASQEAEIIAQSPKSPYIGAVGQFEGLENMWTNANNTPSAFLHYHPKTAGGQLIGAPQRVQPPQVPLAYVQAKTEIIEDMKAVSGLQQANFGGRDNETSGVALREKKTQGNTSSFHFPDNLATALSHEGRVINQMMPTIYPPDTIVSVMGKDDEVKTKKLGQMEKGVEFSLGEGEFDVVCDVGKSFNTQREEAASSIVDAMRFVPSIGQFAGDVAVKAMDWPMKDKIADRIKEGIRITVPGMNLEDEDEVNKEAMMQNVLNQTQQQLQQAGQQIQMMQQELQNRDQQKMAMDQAKVQDDSKRTELIDKQMMINADIEKAKLALEGKKLEVDAQKTDLQEHTKLKISKQSHVAGLDNIVAQGRIKQGESHQLKLDTKETQAGEQSKNDNLLSDIKKTMTEFTKPQSKSTKITKTKEGFKGVSTYEDGSTVTTLGTKNGKGYDLKSGDNDGK